MWYDVLPSAAAVFACLSLLEIAPFVCHYISWGCPMMRNSNGEISLWLLRRDQRIAENNGIPWRAKHMYTYSFESLGPKLKMSGNFDHYIEAEKMLEKNFKSGKN